jgi:hypothetical protein
MVQRGINTFMTHANFKSLGGAALALTFLLGTSIAAFGDDINNTNGLTTFQIMENVRVTYTSLSSYGDEGQITEEMDGTVTTTTFTTRLNRESLYLIQWDRFGGSTPLTQDSGIQAVWASGSGNFSVIGTSGVLSRHDRDSALAYAAAASSGATTTIPGVFYNMQWTNQPDDVLSDADRQPNEKIGGIDCYVLTGQTPSGETRTLWIGRQDYLIRQIRTEVSAQGLQADWAHLAHGSPAFTKDPHGFVTVETHNKFVLDEPFSRDSFIPAFPLYRPLY